MEEGTRLLAFSTSGIDPRLRARAYRRWLRPFAEVFFADEASAHASVDAYAVDDIAVALTDTGPVHYLRPEHGISRAGMADYVLFQLVVRGAIHANFRHRSMDLTRDDIFCMDMTTGYEAWTDHCRCLHFLVPHAYLQQVARFIHGRVIHGESLAGRMLASHLARCLEFLRSGQRASAVTAIQTALDLVVQGLTDAQVRDDHDAMAHSAKQPVLAYIEEHLTCPSLDPDHITALFNISRATLYRMFAECGGVQQFIRDRRLDAALRDICRTPGMSISEVACHYGFSSDRQFQRAFRAKFGITARDARADWQSDPFGHRLGSQATF